MPTKCNGERVVFSTNCVGIVGYSPWKDLDPYLYHTKKNVVQMDPIDLNIKTETITLLEKKNRKSLWFGVAKDFLDITPKAQSINEFVLINWT